LLQQPPKNNDGVELVDKGEVFGPATHNNIGMELAQ
jgi:hypothetical protein